MRRIAMVAATLALLGGGLVVVVPAAPASAYTSIRFQGADRFATSAAIAQASYSPGVPVAYIATGLDFPDALAGGAAAAKAGGPLLLVRPDLIPTQIAAELTRLTPGSIVVLGGTGAVSQAVFTSLQTYTSGSVRRVSGADRYGTAANLAASFPTGSPVFIATGRDFPDALAGTAAAAAKHAAILLTTPTAIPSDTAAALSALAPSSITILGGTGAVSAAVATQLGAHAPTVTRLWGSDRYATAASIARSAFPSATGVFITTGAGFADALTGGPVAGSAGQPLLLATVTCLPTATAAVVTADTPTTVTLLGGTGVLGAGVASLTSCAAPSPTGVSFPVTTPAPTVPTMAVGARAKAESPASISQLRAAFAAASTDIGPLSATRAFEGTLPVDQSQRISATGNIEVTSYKSAGSSSLAPFVKSMPVQDMIAFYHEPEGPGDWSSGAAYVAAFNAEYKAAHAANPKVQFGMIAGAYQYRTAGLGYSGTFIPPLADFYAIDTYRDGSSENAYGAIVPLTQVTEFQRWLSLVKPKGKPLLVTEYGRGTVGSGELATAAGKRAVVIAQDLPYLRSLGFTMISYWYSDFGPDGRKWRFTDQASIDAWRSG